MPLLLLARRHLAPRGRAQRSPPAGVACGVALVVAIEVINASTLGAFTDAIEDLAGTAALQVRGAGRFPRRSPTSVRACRASTHAVPILTDTFFLVDGPAAGEALSVFAADVTDGHAIKTLRLVALRRARGRRSPRPSSSTRRSVILTDVFAHRIDAHVGTTLRLRTPVGVQTFTVRGILPPGGVGRAFGGNLLLMDVVGAQTVLGRERLIDQVDVALAPDADVDGRGARRARRAAARARGRCRPARRGEQIERILRSYRTLLSGISGLALLAAIFVVASAVATSVAARRQQIGLLRCVGRRARPRAPADPRRGGAARRARHRARHPARARPGAPAARHGRPSRPSWSSRSALFPPALDVSPRSIALGAAAGLGATLVAARAPGPRRRPAISPLAAVRTAAQHARSRGGGPRRACSSAAIADRGGRTRRRRCASTRPGRGNLAALAADVALVCLVHAPGRAR